MSLAPAVKAHLEQLHELIIQNERAEQRELRQIEAWRNAIDVAGDRLVKIRDNLKPLRAEYAAVQWAAEQSAAYFEAAEAPQVKEWIASRELTDITLPQPDEWGSSEDPDIVDITEVSAPPTTEPLPELSGRMARVYAAVPADHPLRSSIIAKNAGIKSMGIGCYLRRLRECGKVQSVGNREWMRA